MANGDITVTTTITGTTTAGSTMKGFSNVKTYSSIVNVFETELLAPTSVATVCTIAAALAGSSITTLNYFVIKNMDSTNFITLGLMSASDTSYHKIPAGCSFSVCTIGQDTNVTAAALSTIVAFTSISVLADTAACKVGICFF